MTFPTTCKRCGAGRAALIMSRFNTDMICLDCEDDERMAPGYTAAMDAENAAVAHGDFHYRGVGLSADDAVFLQLRRRNRFAIPLPRMDIMVSDVDGRAGSLVPAHPTRTTWDDFALANTDLGPGTLALARKALDAGEDFDIGGNAAPLVRLTRIDPLLTVGDQEFRRKLDDFILAGDQLLGTWQRLDHTGGYYASGYPERLPSFDEFLAELRAWREAVA